MSVALRPAFRLPIHAATVPKGRMPLQLSTFSISPFRNRPAGGVRAEVKTTVPALHFLHFTRVTPLAHGLDKP